MSLDVYLYRQTRGNELASFNITHNLTTMAEAAGVYAVVWRPEENGITKAGQLIKPLQAGIRFLEDNKAECEKHNPTNGWGDYKALIGFLRDYLDACIEYPDANVYACR